MNISSKMRFFSVKHEPDAIFVGSSCQGFRGQARCSQPALCGLAGNFTGYTCCSAADFLIREYDRAEHFFLRFPRSVFDGE